MFIDETKLEVHAGHGGKGMVSFRREKFVPLGGPSGGNGGRGGHVILVASHDIHTLYDIGNKRIFRADHGGKGEPSLCTGKNGEDIRLPVPVGTLVKDLVTGDLIADLRAEGQECVVAQGGRGGIGNAAFKSSTNRAPRQSTPGDEGQSRKLQLELKLVADCGLVGFPNAGKSSLIRRLSAATPKVADYPFTTVKPVLGIVEVGAGRSFVLVDIPGLIEGAAEGKGLGHQFLRHVERSACLAYVLDSSENDPYGQYQTLRSEMEKFHPLLLQKPKLIVFNKIDLGEFDIDPRFLEEGCPVLRSSAITGEGLPELKEAIRVLIGEKGIRKQGW
jgi:GTP-binding protein